MVAVLSQEIFGVALALPDFPAIKGVRGIGMSDPPVRTVIIGIVERVAVTLSYSTIRLIGLD